MIVFVLKLYKNESEQDSMIINPQELQSFSVVIMLVKWLMIDRRCPIIKISIAQYISCSISNGPGRRAVIWLYGCDKNCIDCCNPSFQKFIEPNTDISEFSSKINKDYDNLNLRGFTFSGGEPLHPLHADAVKQIITNIKTETNADIMAFSGYTQQEIQQMEWVTQYFDLIIAGPYIKELKNKTGILASNNQEILRFNDKFEDVNDYNLKNDKRIIETYIDNKGNIIVTGLISNHEINVFQ